MAFSWNDYGTVTSEFGYRGNINVPGASTNHHGIDVVLKSDNIPAFCSGVVVDKGTDGTRGNWLKIAQDDGYTATYMHMAKLSTLQKGQSVSYGQTVGTQGTTGVSSGKHLHYQLQAQDGTYVDPRTYETREASAGSNSLLSSLNPVNIVQDKAESILGSIFRVLAIALVVILAGYLFMKAFDIKLFKL